MAKCVAGASVQELCCFADQKIMELTGAVYKKEKEMKKGKVQINRGSKRPFECLTFARHFISLLHFCQQLHLPFLSDDERQA